MRRTASSAPASAGTGFATFLRAVIFLSSIGLVACDRDVDPEGERPITHEQFSYRLIETGLAQTVMGQRWLDSARDALRNPLEIVPPYAESGGFVAHQAAAVGLVFDAYDGQTLHLRFDRHDTSSGQVFVELFYVGKGAGDTRYMPLHALAPEDRSLQTRLLRDGRYLLRLQPELLADTLYELRIELDAAVPFPIPDGDAGVGSFFGDPRDAGSRQHEGIDIFMPRHTPVVAVAPGRAIARTTARGGNVVWLRASGESYYYAHLEKAAFSGARIVEAGEVLGYVGNSGNARSTPPHLHFGVYRRGHGAVDPLPRLAARIFEEPVPAVSFQPRYVRIEADTLNLRAAPMTSAEIVGQLGAGSVVRALAMRGDWLRVRTPGQGSGWIHSSYQEDPAPLAQWQPQNLTWLLDGATADARPVAVSDVNDTFEVIGQHGSHLLVRSADGMKEGWVDGSVPADAEVVVSAEAEADGDERQGNSAPGAGS